MKAIALLLALSCASCASAGRRAVEAPSAPLVAADGETLDIRVLAERATLTVVVFFAADCHYLAVHEPRLVALYDAYRPRGVQFVMVDSEERGSPAGDEDEARRRGYPFAILVDRGAKLADALGAEYAAYAVVLDSTARIRYRGGIDTDKTHLHDDATPYLRDALDDLLAKREPRLAEGKTLGCALQKW